MHTGLAAASSAAKLKDREAARSLESSAFQMKRHCLTGKNPSWCSLARASNKRKGGRRKRETIWGSFLRGVGLVTDAWWQMQFSDLSDWCVTASLSCLLPWIQGSAHLSRDRYSPSPGPVSVINLNIKHVSCHTARERYYPMKRVLMNRSRRCDDGGVAAGEPASPATRCAPHIHFLFFPPARLLRLKTTWRTWKHVWKVPLCYRLFFWQQRVGFLK